MIDSQRYPRLARIASPAELRAFDEAELPAVAGELRDYLIESVGKSGGHFGAGLGVVELTTALHWIYDTPSDRIVWDVGHQCYPHKILTGRRDSIHTVKQKDGVAPFPKREESEYDAFGVGHSSTSISAALGMAIANARAGIDRKVVAVIGDGAMTAGMAYEALNHAGGMDPEPDLLVILNDNRMSISEAVGGMTRMLGRMTGSRTLNALREGGKKLLGDKNKPPAKFVRRWEEHWKGMFVPSTLFEEMGFHYTGPIDGHDMKALVDTLRTLKGLKGPQLLHVITTKGKGYELAEGDQIGYHAVGPFDPAKGLPPKTGPKKPTYTDVFSDWLCDMAIADQRLMGITPAMREGSGLVRFSKEHPARYFDVAIAEQHAVTLAAGMACEGAKPVVAIYSTFLQRGYDQVVHDVAIQGLPVRFAIDRAGLVGADGPTHAGSFDVGFLGQLPGMVLMAPSDEAELARAVATAVAIDDRPSGFRYPRGEGVGLEIPALADPLEIGKGRIVREGSAVAILSLGTRLGESLRAADLLAARGLSATVADARFAKPVDLELLLRLAREHEALITVEEGAMGGFGAFVLHALADHGALDRGLRVRTLTLPDIFQDQDKPEAMYAQAGLDADGIVRAALNALGIDNASAAGRRA